MHMPPSSAPQPASLADALARIAQLEQQLARAEHVVRLELGKLLREADQAGALNPTLAPEEPSNAAARPAPSLSTANPAPKAPAAAPTDGEAPSDPAPEPLDIGPFVLRALALRKSVHAGALSDADAARELEAMWGAPGAEGAGLSEEQRGDGEALGGDVRTRE
ncbi:hypothetical protein Rhopal_002685-T1 [Rhodotorula paludigena]|uniref:Uncharacterized protein n=1 Tax=Rhodotorula paludigena TaxID=86838 RepID=A0AAV5GHU4_9BASI|nr:hypothetical protein Rhopal_002685-T1 [Rhodotorula paludigena]